jgi:membrane associated rhomboid family serine protease
MFRRRGENLHTIYIFLFLNVAFFFLEYQDQPKFARLFSFDRTSFLSGQYWRIITYQFAQSGQGWAFIPIYIMFFFSLVLTYMFGAALEEEWGSLNCIAFFLISTIATAIIAAWLGVTIIGCYFTYFTLLFVYAAAFPEQTLYLFAVIPIRVRWLAWIVAGTLVYGTFAGSSASIPVLGGAIVGYVFYLLHRAPAAVIEEGRENRDAPKLSAEMPGVRNAARFVAMKKAIAAQNDAEIDRLIAQSEREIVQGVNICPPADYKPEHHDGYCIRCEGYAECSVRYLRLNRTRAAADAQTHSPLGALGEPPPP